MTSLLVSMVALRKESVDRNTSFCPARLFDLPSLSARRAWIEIDFEGRLDADLVVSLSARRAWIEIGRHRNLKFLCAVALRKESVDRNFALPYFV